MLSRSKASGRRKDSLQPVDIWWPHARLLWDLALYLLRKLGPQTIKGPWGQKFKHRLLWGQAAEDERSSDPGISPWNGSSLGAGPRLEFSIKGSRGARGHPPSTPRGRNQSTAPVPSDRLEGTLCRCLGCGMWTVHSTPLDLCFLI